MAEVVVSSAIKGIGDSLINISRFLNEASSSISPCTYDVFLSFRGADTRTNFTDHLYATLRQARIHTFRDDDEIERGENINAELQRAIKESNISIIVFSKDYASSRWCLDELVMIMERRRTVGHTVVPVFYDVDPSLVRKQAGSFGEAFARHEMRFKEDKVESWRAALREVADLAGEELGNRHQTSFIQDIVKMIGTKLYPPVKDQVEDVQTRLNHIKPFLNDADSKASKGDERVRNWVAQIRDLAYDAEDVIETYALQVESVRSKEGTMNALRKFAGVLWQELDPITAKISELTSSLQTYGINLKDGSSSFGHQRLQSYPHVVEPYFVGRDESIEELVKYLVDNEKNCKIISICGMGGLGKTTLAKKVYHHGKVKRHFDYFAWSCISQQCKPRDVWEGILIKLNEPRNEIKKLRDEELAEKLYQVQQEKRCLVILDDIWSTQDWDNLKDAFPIYEGTSSKILLTTRNKDVALHADPSGFHYEPRCLTEEESWELLQKIAIPQKDGADLRIDIRMELGKKMVKHCGGLPLAITVLGGVLATKDSLEWHIVLKTIKSCLKRGKGHGKEQLGVSGVLSLSYDDLPIELKPCFLYLSHFPEDYKINVDQLIQLWVAEGIIPLEQHSNGEGVETMEDVAQRYLNELEKRCMVLVAERDKSLRITSYRMHDLMRDFCLSKAEEENFFRIVDCRNEDVNVDSFPSSSSGKIRRLAIYSPQSCSESPLKHINNSLLFFHLRCLLLCLSETPYSFQLEMPNFNNLKLIRVLDVNGPRLRKDIGELIHLRYLRLSSWFTRFGFKLSSSLGNLRYLQTLNLLRIKGIVYVPNVLWKMEGLRHLYLPKKCYCKTKLQLGNLRSLQTLVNFSFKNFDVSELLNNIKNLVVLKILKLYLIKNFGEIFKSQDITLQHLRSLDLNVGRRTIDVCPFVLSCINLHELTIKGWIEKLPDQLPASITNIKLKNAKLRENWENSMTALQKLPSLRTLTLCSIFGGKQLFCSREGFPRLYHLRLSCLDNLKEWRVDEGALPNLCHLEILCCKELKRLPDGLRFVKTLKELVINLMPKTFEEKLVEGGEDFYKVQHVPSRILQDIDIDSVLKFEEVEEEEEKLMRKWEDLQLVQMLEKEESEEEEDEDEEEDDYLLYHVRVIYQRKMKMRIKRKMTIHFIVALLFLLLALRHV